jgi:hypothetical protein
VFEAGVAGVAGCAVEGGSALVWDSRSWLID